MKHMYYYYFFKKAIKYRARPRSVSMGSTGLPTLPPLLCTVGGWRGRRDGHSVSVRDDNSNMTRSSQPGPQAFRPARRWHAASGRWKTPSEKSKQYIINEARMLFQKNKNLTDSELTKQCIDECAARIEIGLHYQIPYPRPIHLPPMALTSLQSCELQA
ncbi:LYR motif-containing protein 1-like [Vombatus ursinus]|uniref:LYR motif-containing protein 1-like n=1 Tax=Vombatus ursinus TaxID=29139 RepID=UPI000FFD9CD9|nr:LYR motif-containing protein 1-like [Vombatus ursinus]XP_027718179.1 LYR motif-containing protein 1-like [Vombatus ursinus]